MFPERNVEGQYTVFSKRIWGPIGDASGPCLDDRPHARPAQSTASVSNSLRSGVCCPHESSRSRWSQPALAAPGSRRPHGRAGRGDRKARGGGVEPPRPVDSEGAVRRPEVSDHPRARTAAGRSRVAARAWTMSGGAARSSSTRGWIGGTARTRSRTEFRILGLPDDGTFAERVKVPASQVVDKPTHLSVPQAAALPLAGSDRVPGGVFALWVARRRARPHHGRRRRRGPLTRCNTPWRREPGCS